VADPGDRPAASRHGASGLVIFDRKARLAGYDEGARQILRLADPAEGTPSYDDVIGRLGRSAEQPTTKAGRPGMRCRVFTRDDGEVIEACELPLPEHRHALILTVLTRQRQELRRLRLFELLSRRIVEASSLHEALLIIMRTVGRHGGWEYGEAWVPRADGTALVLGPCWNAPGRRFADLEDQGRGRSFAVGEGLPGRVWQSHRAELIGPHGLTGGRRFVRGEAALAEGLRSMTGVPLLAGDTVVAVLVLASSRERSHDPLIVDLLVALGGQLGSLLKRIQAEEREFAVQRRIADLLETAAEAIVSVDSQQRIVVFNRAAEQTFGYSAAEVLGKPLDALLPSASRARHADMIAAFAKSPETRRLMGGRPEVRGLHKDGREFPAEASISKTGQGAEALFTVLLRDISANKRREAELRESQALLRTISDNIPGIVYRRVRTPDGRIRYPYVSDGVRAIYGMAPETITADPAAFLATIHAEDREAFMASLERSAAELTQWSHEFRITAACGTTKWVRGQSRPRREPDGSVIWDGVLLDISEQRQAEQALEESERNFRAIAQSTPFGLVISRVDDGRILFANDSVEAVIGVTRADLLRSKAPDFFADPADRGRAAARMREYGSIRDFEFQARLPDGRLRWVLLSATPIEFDGTQCVLSGFYDVTERKLAEAALRASQMLFGKVFAVSPDVITLTNLETGRYIAASDSFLDLYGYRPDEIVGKTSGELGIWVDPAFRPELVRQLRAGEKVRDAETSIRHRSGAVRHVSISAEPLAWQDEEVALIVARDITPRIEAARSLRRLNRNLQVLSAGVEAVVRAASESELLQEICRIFVETGGYSLAWIGRAEDDARKSVTPVGRAGRDDGYVDAVRASWSENDERGRGATGTAIRSGRPVAIRYLQDSADMAPWRKAARRMGFGSSIALPVSAGGRAIGAICVYSGEPDAFDAAEQELLMRLADSLGHGIRALRAARDLVAAKEEAELANRAKSDFLAMMSHELRTPLNAIIGFSEIMQSQMVGPLGSERYVEYSRDINRSGNHLLNIVNDVLDIARIEAGRMELNESRVDLAALIESCVAMIGPRAEAGRLDIAVEVEAGLPGVRADRRVLKQILVNLLSNAVKFTEPGGAVRVGARRDPDGGVAAYVADTGIGMRPEDIGVALKPFAQVDNKLARRYEGTGLGLPLVKSYTEMHGGWLSIDSTPGAGTTVTVHLPPARVEN
jgi:PAS domain S-box-containing protein